MNPVTEQNDSILSTSAGVYHCSNWICGWQGEIPLWMQKEFYVNHKIEPGWYQTRELRTIACCPQCYHPAQYFITSGGKGEENGKGYSQSDSRSDDTYIRGFHSRDPVSGIRREEESRHGLDREDSLLPRDGLDYNYDWDGDPVLGDLVRFVR